MLELDESPSGKWLLWTVAVGLDAEDRERRAVRLYAEGRSNDAVTKLLGMVHRRLQGVLLDPGIPMRFT